jgi:DNA adenine methylase
MSAIDIKESYRGGKAGSGVFQKIISLMPPHAVYVECFLGAGAILRAKRPAAVNVGVEINKDVLNTHWPDAPEQIDKLTIYEGDAVSFLRSIYLLQFDAKQTLIYLDPPYLMSVRSSKQRIYADEFHTEAEHRELLKLLKKMPQMIMISGYDSPLYNRLLKAWRKVSFTGTSRGGPKTEVVWLNFPEPPELHDYRFLGDNFRKRQDIKRQRDRWLNRLAAMPAQQRYAMFSAIEEFRGRADDGNDADNRSINDTTAIATAETPRVDVCECNDARDRHAGNNYHCFDCPCGFYRPRDHASAAMPISARGENARDFSRAAAELPLLQT